MLVLGIPIGAYLAARLFLRSEGEGLVEKESRAPVTIYL
jgi:hypothetical protein